MSCAEVRTTDAGWAQLWVAGIHIDSAYGEEGKRRVTAKCEKINKAQEERTNATILHMAAENDLLRRVYEAARTLIRFDGIQTVLERQMRVDALDKACEQMKQLDGGLSDDFPPDADPVQAIAPTLPDFNVAWERYKANGYQYGEDALAAVRLGYRMAQEELDHKAVLTNA
jgi:hypothetical protein